MNMTSDMDPKMYDSCVEILEMAGFYENSPFTWISDNGSGTQWCSVTLDKVFVEMRFSNNKHLYVTPAAFIEVIGGYFEYNEKVEEDDVWEEKAVGSISSKLPEFDSINVSKEDVASVVAAMKEAK